ncbi:MAG: flagellar export chaperone FlgN [Spirochaetales bacterium]|nr:flagellar export chaperone FlgN [Spirochaetales bacterium]MDY5916027.1 flagellar export chaperone FlgN [Treponema sp.]
MEKITQEELNERVAILKRFRSLLEQQRNKFREYLTVLEKQQDSINDENTEKLLAHTEIEQQVVQNLSNLQKVIVPMTKMYNSINGKTDAHEDQEISRIQNELSDLQAKVLKQNEINRELLRVHVDILQKQITNFKNPYRNNRSVYANTQSHKIATMVQVEV